MSPQNPQKRSRNDDDDSDVVKVEVVEEVPKVSHVSKKARHENKHEVQAETAAAMLQDTLVNFNTMSPKTSVEVLKVALATTKKLLDNDPTILENLTDEQCRILIHLSKNILKNRRCKALKRKPPLQKSKFKKQSKGWWWVWPL